MSEVSKKSLTSAGKIEKKKKKKDMIMEKAYHLLHPKP